MDDSSVLKVNEMELWEILMHSSYFVSFLNFLVSKIMAHLIEKQYRGNWIPGKLSLRKTTLMRYTTTYQFFPCQTSGVSDTSV